jgi:hypothetical protein
MTLNKKLGELLFYISEVAVSARMNTAYNGRSIRNSETPRAAMWLIDMLHNFHGLGNALAEEKYSEAAMQIDELKSIWSNNKQEIDHSLTVNEHGYTWSVEQGIELLCELKTAVLNTVNTECFSQTS